VEKVVRLLDMFKAVGDVVANVDPVHVGLLWAGIRAARSHAAYGTLDGLAKTLSAAGRAAGPFVSGALFTAATKFEGEGELLAFGTFGGISVIGFLLSLGIRGAVLEADGFDNHDDGEQGGVDVDKGAASPDRRRRSITCSFVYS
jgi:hypothetical protein